MELRVPQGTYLRSEREDHRWLANSPELSEAAQQALARLANDFGARPEGMRCAAATLACPLDKRTMVVARVADVGPADAPPVGLGFHFLLVPRAAYAALASDPFLVFDACPTDWLRRGDLPLATLDVSPKSRNVADVVAVIQRADCATLLGGAQALVDGCKLAWTRTTPADDVIRALWTLLPTSTRGELSLATFAFGNALQFDAVVVPGIAAAQFDRLYLSEEQAANYPEGRYELALQAAAESGDQDALDAQFGRRSRTDVWRMGWWLLGALVVLTVAAQLLKLALK